MLTLERMMEKAESYAKDQADYRVVGSNSGFHGNGDLTFNFRPDDEPVSFVPEDGALGQIADRLNIPAGYLRRCPPVLQAQNLNTWLWGRRGTNGDKELFVRTDGDRVRAFLSHVYSPIDNLEVLEMVNHFVVDKDYEIKRSYLSRDLLHLRILFRNLDGVGPEDGNYGLGFYVSNGEIGNRKVIISPLLQRNSCTNSTVWLEGGWQARHAHHSPGWLRNTFQEMIGQSLNASDHMLEQIAEAERVNIPDLSSVIDRLAKKHGMTDDERSIFVFGMEGKHNVLGVINGLTFLAGREDTDQQERAPYLEAVAGRILAAPERV